MEKKTMNILVAATGVVVGYLLFCKWSKQSGAKSLANATPVDAEDLGEEEAPTSGGGGGGMMSGSSLVLGTPTYQNYPAQVPPITINTPPTMVINSSQLSNAPSTPSGETSSPAPISTVTATRDIPTNTTNTSPIQTSNTSPIQTTKPLVSSIVNPTTAAKFSGFMEFDGNEKFMSELL